MKILFNFFLLSLTLVGSLIGQRAATANNESFRNRIYGGIKLGANLSNVYDGQGEQFVADSKLGFASGLFLSVPIGKYFGIQPELLFSQKGFRSTGRILGGSYDLTRTSNYLDLPILVAIKPSSMVTLFLGPQYSYLLSQKNVFKNGSTTIEQEKEFSNENLRKNTLCFTGGADLNFSNLVIGLRVGWDVQSNNGDGTSTTPRYKNYWYQGTLGWRF